MFNTPRHLRKGSNQFPELDHNRLQIDHVLQGRALSFIQSSPDFAKVQAGEMAPSVFIEQVVASSPKELSSAVRVMCAVILGAFVMQGCAASQIQVQAEKVPNVCDLANDGVADKWVDREFVMETVRGDPGAIECADPSFKKDKDFIRGVVWINSGILAYVDESLTRDRNFMLEMVGKNGMALQYADGSLKKDRKVVLTAIEQDDLALRYVDKSLWKDKEFVLQALRGLIYHEKYYIDYVISTLDKSLWGDPDFVLRAFEEEPNIDVIELAFKLLLKDKKNVLEMIEKNPNNPNIAHIIMRNDIDGSLKKDRGIVLAFLIRSRVNVWDFFDKYPDSPLRKDREFILALTKHYDFAIEYADESLGKDKEFVIKVIQQNGSAIKHIDESLRMDKEFMIKVIQQNGLALEYVDKSFKENKEIVLTAVQQNGLALKFADYLDCEIVLTAVQQNGLALKFADFFKGNIFVVLAAVQQNGLALEFASESFKKDDKVLKEYLQRYANGFGYNFSKLIGELRELNIDFLERFRDFQTLEEIIKNRKNIKKEDSRLLAVAIYTKDDHNDAFQNNQIEELIGHGYNVIYFEAGTENEVYNALKSATIDVGKKADLLVLAGHGRKERINFDGSYRGDEGSIDILDKSEMIELRGCLSKKSVLILESCSTGRGKKGGKNIANILGRIFSQTEVFAPTVPTSVATYEYDENNRIIGVNYRKGKKYTYMQKPKKVTASNSSAINK